MEESSMKICQECLQRRTAAEAFSHNVTGGFKWHLTTLADACFMLLLCGKYHSCETTTCENQNRYNSLSVC